MNNADMLRAIFAGVSFDLVKNRAIMPNGTLLDRRRFNVEFGGREYPLDEYGFKTTPSAWIAFTRNPIFKPPYIATK